MKPGARLGFVTPASWLTADYATALQRLLMHDLRLVAIVASSAESFFPQVQINAVLLVAEKIDPDATDPAEPLRFVTMKKPIAALTEGKGSYWDRVIRLGDLLLNADQSFEDDSMRLKMVPIGDERTGLAADPNTARNWSKFMRAPLSYYTLFGSYA